MKEKETITAIATASGIGALAVIRISGSESFEIFSRCIKEKDKFNRIKEKEISLYTFIDKNEIIDEITAVKYVVPKSYTGEDMIEIISHGGIITVNQIIKKLIDSGARIAKRGEFTRRAFENNKIDIYKAEAIRNIIESTSIIENKIALRSYYGNSIKKIEKIKEKIIKILCDIESEIEFDEDDDIKEKEKTNKDINQLYEEIKNEIERREVIKEVNRGIKVIIAGPANAGKSTLYNKLLGYKRSIVNEEPGTTRDIITEKILINKSQITIIDSAGIRKTENKIEVEGIKRSKEEIKEASMIIWVTSAEETIDEEEKSIIEELKEKRTIFIINKIEISNGLKEKYYKSKKIECFYTSLINDQEINKIQNEIEKNIKDIENKVQINEIIINERQEIIIKDIYENLRKSIENWNTKEIAAIFLNESLRQIEELTGKISSEEVLNNIFDKYCIGK